MSHYTANIEVTRTWKEPVKDAPRRSNLDPVPTERRTESFRVTVRADSMDKLKKKVVAHIQLMDRDDLEGEN